MLIEEMKVNMANNQKNIFNKTIRKWIVFGIFCFIVIITLIIIEYNKDTPNALELWQNIVLSTMCSIVASVIYNIIHRAYTINDADQTRSKLDTIEENLKIQNELYDNGIISIHPKSHFDNEEDYWNGIIEETNTKLNLIGHSISKWFKSEYKDTFLGKIKQMLESDNKINIILSSNNIDTTLSKVKKAYADRRMLPQLTKVEKTILNLCEYINKNVAEDKRKFLNVYVTDLSKVTYLYIRTDRQCIISPYTHSLDDHQNSFLLELKPGTSYVKSLEDDYDEMIGKMIPVDLSMVKKESDNGLKKIQTKSVENKYSGSNWNNEKTEKLVFQDNHGKYEVGYFEHYMDKKYVKTVIELPVSYGCPAKCSYCASSQIENLYKLTSQQLAELFDKIYVSKRLSSNRNVVLSLTGMGDIYFNQENVLEFLKNIQAYNNLQVTCSSTFWNTDLLGKIVSLKDVIKIRYIQYTHISENKEIVKKLIQAYRKQEISLGLDDYIEFILKNDESFFRINYIVIEGINDSKEQVDIFIEKISSIKEKVVVRISKLNETKATVKNALKPTNIDKLYKIKTQMESRGINCYTFYAEKNDNMNCGQLLTE